MLVMNNRLYWFILRIINKTKSHNYLIFIALSVFSFVYLYANQLIIKQICQPHRKRKKRKKEKKKKKKKKQEKKETPLIKKKKVTKKKKLIP